jgi:replicative DNA helicase
MNSPSKMLIPPHSEEAEKAVLGSILIDKDSFIKVYDLLTKDDFYFDKHKIIWESICELFNKHSPVDILTLSNILEEKNMLEKLGGMEYIAELSTSTPSSSHIFSYGLVIKNKAIRRKMIVSGDLIMGMGYEEANEIENDLEKAEKSVFSLSQTFVKDKFVPITDILQERFDFFAELHSSEDSEQLSGVASGFSGLDEMLNGFKPSDLIILAARPSMGKTALSLNIALNASLKHKKRIGIFSLEMSKEQIVDRLFCMNIAIDSWKLHKGRLDDDEFQKLGTGMDELMQAKIYIDDSVGASLPEVRAKARRLQMEHGLDMIIIDYLQLMSSGNVGLSANRVQEISEISRSLKQLGRELNVPILCLSQLSRAVETRPGKIPQLADLRDSGSIEQDADVVIMIYREEYYEPDTDKVGVTDLFIKKNRNGPVGRVELKWNAQSMRFSSEARQFFD